MAGDTPPPGVYLWDTFALYQGAGNLYPATGSANSKRITENFVADLAIVGWVPDFRIFGADPGFSVTVPFASDRNGVHCLLVGHDPCEGDARGVVN